MFAIFSLDHECHGIAHQQSNFGNLKASLNYSAAKIGAFSGKYYLSNIAAIKIHEFSELNSKYYYFYRIIFSKNGFLRCD